MMVRMGNEVRGEESPAKGTLTRLSMQPRQQQSNDGVAPESIKSAINSQTQEPVRRISIDYRRSPAVSPNI